MSSTPQGCVVDASVGILVCVAEPLSPLADALLASVAASPPAQLYVPDLFYVECGNILWKYVQRLGYPPAKAQLDLKQLRALHLQSTPTWDLVEDALPIALAHGITVYDACYAALAQRLKVPLITADQKLVNKLSGTPHAVQWLGSRSLPPAQTP